MNMKSLIAALAVGMLLAACGGTAENASGTPTLPDGGDVISGEATVEEVNLVFMESFPLQVRAVVKGYLADSCTTIDQTTVERVENTFQVTITTRRPAHEMCAQMVQPFEKSIALDVYGLPAGEYTVVANGVSTSFTFTQDNILPDGG